MSEEGFVNEYAFPVHGSMGEVVHQGMTLRDYFASRALQGMLASPPVVDRTTVDKDMWSQQAYAWANAMLRARAG